MSVIRTTYPHILFLLGFIDNRWNVQVPGGLFSVTARRGLLSEVNGFDQIESIWLSYDHFYRDPDYF